MKNNLLFISILALTLGCTTPSNIKKGYTNKGKALASSKLSPETIWQLGRIGNVSVSPNQENVVYTVSYTNIEENKSYTDIFLTNIANKEKHQLTNTKTNEFSVKWNPSGEKINFLSTESGNTQLWEIDLASKNRKQITNIENGINDYLS